MQIVGSGNLHQRIQSNPVYLKDFSQPQNNGAVSNHIRVAS